MADQGLTLNFGVAANSGAVPEPESRPAMIAGFGWVGGALRRRHGAVAAI